MALGVGFEVYSYYCLRFGGKKQLQLYPRVLYGRIASIPMLILLGCRWVWEYGLKYCPISISDLGQETTTGISKSFIG